MTPGQLHVQHKDVAREARLLPGQWILVRHYRDPMHADRVARWIRNGEMGAYQPAGRYRGRTEPDAGQFAVYVRCEEA